MPNGKNSETAADMAGQVNALLSMLELGGGKDSQKKIGAHFLKVLKERNSRAEDVQSPEIKTALAIITKLVPVDISGVLCIDGRLGPAVKFGIPAGCGRFLRTPGGDISEFVHKEGRHRSKCELKLLAQSDFAERLNILFAKVNSTSQILDSHLGCAAREAEENGKGYQPKDGGLYADVLRKELIAEAMIDFVAENYPSKTIYPVQFSYDPHSGFGYMGLEAVLDKTDEFTADVLAEFADKGLVISTKNLAREFREVFKDYAPKSFDPKGDYKNSLLDFWMTMEKMYTKVLPQLEKKFLKIYPKLRGANLRQRAVLALMNSFSGFLNNLNTFGNSEHTEEVVVLTEREYGPFNSMSFPVYSLDLDAIPANSVFAASIIRANRKNKRIHGSPEEPVPMIVQEIIREAVPEEVWTKFGRMDFKVFLYPNWWMNAPRSEEYFYRTARRFYSHIPFALIAGLNELRKKMGALYNPRSASSKHLTEGSLVPLPVIADHTRKTRAIVSFVLNGY